MIRRIFQLGLAMGAVAAFSAMTSAATTEEVLAKLTAKGAEMKTYEADMKTIAKITPTRESVMTGHMATQVAEKDGKPVGTLMNMRQKGKDPNGMDSEMLMVNDGEFVWMETKDPESGMVMVMKMKPGMQQMQTGDAKKFTDEYDLKLVGEEEFDGQKMWVLEGASKVKPAARPRRGMGMGAPEPASKVRISVGQKDSLLHRFVQFDAAGHETSEMQFTHIKVNPKLDAKLFKYTPPPGAQVMDMTRGMPGMDRIRDVIPDIPNVPGVDE